MFNKVIRSLLRRSIYGQTNSIINVSIQVLQLFKQKHYISAFIIYKFCSSVLTNKIHCGKSWKWCKLQMQKQKKVKVTSGGFESGLKMFFPSTGLGHGHTQEMILTHHCCIIFIYWALLWKKLLYSHILGGVGTTCLSFKISNPTTRIAMIFCFC